MYYGQVVVHLTADHQVVSDQQRKMLQNAKTYFFKTIQHIKG